MIATTTWTHFLAQAAILVPAFLISVSFHEFCHAAVATLLGDDTAKKLGRLTLNPLAHIDVLGLLVLILFRFGWANPVPMDPRNFKYPRLYEVITAFAGPLSNFLLAILSMLLLKYLPAAWLSPAIYLTMVQLLQACIWVNIMLGVFNMLPIPPLDGSHVLSALLIKRFPNFVATLYRYSLFILLFIFLLPPARQWLLNLMIYVEKILKSFIF